MPESAVLHEQKAQVLLEIGDSWNALKAATREAQFLFYFYFPNKISYAFIMHDRSIKNDRTLFPYAIFEMVLFETSLQGLKF